MRNAVGAWCVVVLCCEPAIDGAAFDDAGDTVAQTHQTEHYDLVYEGDVDAADLGNLLEALHPLLKRYFGKAPDQRLRIEILADEQRFQAALAKAGQPHEGGGGVYGPTFETAWLFVQPSEYYTRHLLLHEATHQFHYLVATGNEDPAAKWYVEGLADYMGQHTWDGQRLQVGVVPQISLEDYPAEAMAEFEAAEWSLAAIVAGQREVGRAAGWMLVHFLINRDFEAFHDLGSRLDRRDDSAIAFAETFGDVSEEMGQDLRRWAADHQQPWDDVWLEWQSRGDALEGHSKGVALCLVKQTPQKLEVELRDLPENFKAGVAFGYQSPEDFRMLQIWDDGQAHLIRRERDKWVVVQSIAMSPTDGNHTLIIEQVEDDRVALTINGKELHRLQAPGRVGLTVDACRARFSVTGLPPVSYRNLTELLDAHAPLADQPPPIADPNRRDAEGRTRLHLAALEGDVDMIQRLLASDADVELTLDNGVTPLMMAAFKRHREIAELLLQAGADVRRSTPRGTTALHYAAVGGDLPLLRSFLDAGAHVEALKPGGTTPLILAAQNGHAAAVEALAEAGADVNARLANQNITGLILAAQNGHPRAVSALLRAGADPQMKDSQRRSALDYARANEHVAVVEILETAAAVIEKAVDDQFEE